MLNSLNIGVITKYSGNNYHGALLNTIHKELQKNNANMFIFNTFMINQYCDEKSMDFVYYKIALNYINGWIILSEGADDQLLKLLHNTGKPIVTVGFIPESIKCISVMEDSRYTARTVTQHLIDHGHKKIAFIGCSYLYDMKERLEGYKEALKDNSISIDPELSFMANITDINMIPLGKSSINILIQKKYEFTAVFAANDLIALGVMDALQESNLRVPDDIAVIGYDDTTHATSNNRSLSSVRQDLNGIGSTAVEELLKLINKKVISSETILVKSFVIKRNSCGCRENPDNILSIFHDSDYTKDIMQEYLKDEIGKSYAIAFELMETDIDKIKNVFTKVADSHSTLCVGLWDDTAGKEKKLFVHQVIDQASKTVYNIDKEFPIENFPPEELLSNLNANNNIMWIFPICTASNDWGIVAFISPIKITNVLFPYDSSVILFNLIGSFLDKVIANAQLNNTLETLNRTLESLQQAQEQLIISEKMVSLGRVVAGVAHEINTPVGVSVTAASFLKDSSKQLREKLNSGKLKRSDLIKLFDTFDETTEILLLNLRKTSDLVRSFKQIAVDQSVEEKRLFNLNEYINEILLSLKPSLNKTKLAVKVDCPQNIDIDTYAGGLCQIITNFVMNSVLHAYDEGDEGNITITASYNKEILVLKYSDDGKGIEKGNLSKIFDPFFTTKRGAGGTGLGLNVVYNIVTRQYYGRIICDSIPGEGTTFIIEIPII